MEPGDSRDRPVPLAAPVYAAIEAPASYYEAIEAIERLAGEFTEATWNAPTPCPEWRAADLAGHLRCMADDYHEYLDDAPVSRLARLMATGAPPESVERKLARQNAAELAALPDAPPQEHIRAYAESARRYAARLGPLLSLPHHSYRGRVITVAGMAGVACVEWHVHAWDLAAALGESYRPRDPEAVVAAWLAGIPYLPISIDGDPWLAVLRASGRLAGLSARPVSAPAAPRRVAGREGGNCLSARRASIAASLKPGTGEGELVSDGVRGGEGPRRVSGARRRIRVPGRGSGHAGARVGDRRDRRCLPGWPG